MKLVEFSVTNFRSITTAHKIKINNTTVLIGKNNEGKSNLLKALSFAMGILTSNEDYHVKYSRRQSSRYDWPRDFPIALQDRNGKRDTIFKLEFFLEAVQDLQGAMDKIFTSGLATVPDDPEGTAYDLGETGTADLFNVLDDGLNAIAEYRATLGSVQARLNSAISNNEITTENLEAAKARIRDVDYAAESTRFAQANILTAAGTAVLTQANARPEAVLQLLRA